MSRGFRKGAGGVSRWTPEEDEAMRAWLARAAEHMPGRALKAVLVRAARMVEQAEDEGEVLA